MTRRFLLALSLTAAAALTTGTALAASYWGSFKNDGCSANTGYRQYSAILWGIPWGYSWDTACHNTSATINGYGFWGATRCVNNGFNEWGQFDVIDRSCGVAALSWDYPNSFCPGAPVLEWTATLTGAPHDAEGQQLCLNTPFHAWSDVLYATSCSLNANGHWVGHFTMTDPGNYCGYGF